MFMLAHAIPACDYRVHSFSVASSFIGWVVLGVECHFSSSSSCNVSRCSCYCSNGY